MQILRHPLRSRAIFPVFPQLLFALMNTCNHSPENSPHTQVFLGEKEENISDFSLLISISGPLPNFPLMLTIKGTRGTWKAV